VVTQVVSMRLLPPPPLRPNASRRWFFSLFRHDSRHHHLPCIQTRAGGGFFDCFDRLPPHHLARVQTRARGGFFRRPTPLPPPPPPSRPNASWRWLFSVFRHGCHHHHLPRVQTRAGGGHFRHFDTAPTTATSLASKRELEVVLFGGFKVSAAAATSPPPANRQRRKWIRGGEADETNVGRVSRMIGRDTREEGQGANDDLLVVVPQSSRQWPPSHL